MSLCISCHLAPQYSGRRICEKCSDASAERRRIRLARRRADAIKLGKCMSCFARPADASRSRCSICQHREATRAQRRYRMKLCSDCPQQASAGRTRCDACLEKSRQYARKQARLDYVPIDEWEARPKTRVMRALRWLGWVELYELWTAMDMSDHDWQDKDRHYQALRRMVKCGEAEQRGSRSTTGGRVTEYRLTPGVSVLPPVDTRICSDEEAEA